MSAFAICIIAIWGFSAIATIFSKDSQCMGAALIATILMGWGYLMIHSR